MDKTTKFIKTIGPLARNEYLSRDKWILPSVCIAQAALESGWNLKAKTLFGIKGSGFKTKTSEFYNGHKVNIIASFRKYPTISKAIVGYYDFITKTPRYAKAVNNPNYKDAVDKLIHTTDGAAYSTNPNYIKTIIWIIEKYNLTIWDRRDDTNDKNLDKLVRDTLKGIYGNGKARKKALGSKYDAVQKRINKLF